MQSDEMLAIENHQISFLLLTDISLIPNILKNIYELSHIDKLLFHFLFFFLCSKRVEKPNSFGWGAHRHSLPACGSPFSFVLIAPLFIKGRRYNQLNIRKRFEYFPAHQSSHLSATAPFLRPSPNIQSWKYTRTSNIATMQRNDGNKVAQERCKYKLLLGCLVFSFVCGSSKT